MSYHAIPLADKGFIPISENNKVRWYVEESDLNKNPRLFGPFNNMNEADKFAENLNDPKSQ